MNDKNMNDKPLQFDYEDNTYIIEFDLKSARRLGKLGIINKELGEGVSEQLINILISHGLEKHHPSLNMSLKNKLCDYILSKTNIAVLQIDLVSRYLALLNLDKDSNDDFFQIS